MNNKLQWLKVISITSLILLGIVCLLKIWGWANWQQYEFQIMGTLAVIFVVTALIHELMRKDAKK